MSRISSFPSGIGMQRCRTPEGLRLYNSPSIMVNDLALRAIRRASVLSAGSLPRSIHSRIGTRQSVDAGGSSISIASASSPEQVSKPKDSSLFEGSSSIGLPPSSFEGEGFEGSQGGLVSMEGLLTSRAKTLGGTVVRPDAILASSSASSLYLRTTWLSSRPSNL